MCSNKVAKHRITKQYVNSRLDCRKAVCIIIFLMYNVEKLELLRLFYMVPKICHRIQDMNFPCSNALNNLTKKNVCVHFLWPSPSKFWKSFPDWRVERAERAKWKMKPGPIWTAQWEGCLNNIKSIVILLSLSLFSLSLFYLSLSSLSFSSLSFPSLSLISPFTLSFSLSMKKVLKLKKTHFHASFP